MGVGLEGLDIGSGGGVVKGPEGFEFIIILVIILIIILLNRRGLGGETVGSVGVFGVDGGHLGVLAIIWELFYYY